MKCLLCQGTVKSLERYKNHLSEEHEMSYGSDIVIAVTFLDEGEKDGLMARVEQRKRQFVEEKIFRITGNIFTNILTDESIDKNVNDKLSNSKQRMNGNMNIFESGEVPNTVVENYQVSEETSDYQEIMPELCLEDNIGVTEYHFQSPANKQRIDEKILTVPAKVDINQNTSVYFTVQEDQDGDGERTMSSSCSETEDLECKLCFTLLSKRGNLSKHMKTVHKHDQYLLLNNKESSFSCPLCPNSTKTENLLRIHTKRNHSSKNSRSPKFEDQVAATENNNHIDLEEDDIDEPVSRLSSNRTIIKTDTSEEFDIVNKSEDKGAYGTTDSTDNSKDSSPSVSAKNDEMLVGDYLSLEVIDDKSLPPSLDNVENKFICNLCYFCFSSLSDLENHQHNEHKEDLKDLGKTLCVENLIYPCNICDLKFLSENIVTVHKRLQHRLHYPLSHHRGIDCVLCKVKFDKNKTLARHMKSYHSNKMDTLDFHCRNSKLIHNCNICGELFYTERSLGFHSIVVHKDNDVHCGLCSLNFKTPIGLLQHKMKIHIDELAAFNKKYEINEFVQKCNYCDKHFPTVGSVTNHMKRKHYRSSINQKLPDQGKHCKLCVINFKSSVGLKRHKKKNHQSELDAFNIQLLEDDLKHQCNKCSMIFYSPNSLICHKRYVHKESTAYCELCHVTFKWSSSYSVHKNKFHKLENKGTDSKLNLKAISDSKLCRHCNKTFHNERNLNYHLRYAHKGPENTADTSCKHCKKEFKAGKNKKRNMERHMSSVHNINGSDVEGSGDQNIHMNFLALCNAN